MQHCPLCRSRGLFFFARDARREYWRCCRCALVAVPPRYYLNAEAERAEYDKHENQIDDPGYRRFLARLAEPLLARLAPGAQGLDFGSGPGPALAAMLSERDMQVRLFDAFYAPDAAVFDASYDFVCATEVVEHLHQPGVELARLWGLLRPGATLGVMTKLVIDAQAFANWHYKNDLTHVCFFSRETWAWWAAQRGAELEFVGSDVMLLRRP